MAFPDESDDAFSRVARRRRRKSLISSSEDETESKGREGENAWTVM